ncbi:DUF4910 domain-containing protein [Candidatus Pelagibacter bacterium]|nr:DUF4910 domain-containing protein [Candidatus Pelagibacter bacterium]
MKKYFKIGKKLFPIFRSITGKGVEKTLKILKKEIKNLKIKKINSGSKVYDWKVPPEWNIKEAYVQDKFGNKIIDIKNNNLHLVSYSQPTKKLISRNELFDRLHYSKKQKKAIPYITSYYKKYWGFCVSFEQYKKLKKKYKKNDKFFININSSFNKSGSLTYGELYLKGESKSEVLISSYICHPSMANNELSGPLVLTALANYYSKKKKLNKSIRFLLIPETIGSIAYINKNFTKLKKNVIGGYVLTCIGDEKNYSYLFSKYQNSLSDRCALKALNDLGYKFKTYSFLERGSDERQFNSPFIDLGIGSIMRSKYDTYKEYHTSLDNFKIISEKGLLGGFKVSKKAIENLLLTQKINLKLPRQVSNKKIITKIFCEPNLGKRDLYPKLSRKENNYIQPKNLLNFLQYADGTNDLKNISAYINLNLKKTKKIFNLLDKNKLINFTKKKKKNCLFLGYSEKETSLISFFKKKGWHVFNKKDKITEYDLENINSYDLIVSYGYRHIINKKILKRIKDPIINLHISYLPFNRGANPNFWSFIDGTPSGVTIHEINSKIDSGPIIFQKKILFDINKKKHETFSKTYEILRFELEKLFKKKFNELVNKNYKTSRKNRKGSYHKKKDLPKYLKNWNMKISLAKKKSNKNLS